MEVAVMTLKQLEYFVTIINTGSFSAAAARLHISQPPLSMQIKALEEEFGTILFERTTRHMRPTDAGRRLYEKALSLLDMAKEIQDDMTQSDTLQAEGRLIIGMISSCGSIMLSPAAEAFSRAYPGIDFELVEGNTFSLLERLKKRELDMTFVRTPFDDSDLTCHYLVTEPLCAVGVPALLPPGPGISPDELVRQPLIIYRRYEDYFRQALSAAGLTYHIRCLNDDARTTLMWAKHGFGIGIIPRSAVSGITEKNPLTVRPVDYPGFETRVAIVHLKTQYLSPAAREFIKCYEAYYKS